MEWTFCTDDNYYLRVYDRDIAGSAMPVRAATDRITNPSSCNNGCAVH